MSADVVVVGAGLAGLTAALRLAEAGRRVVVVAKGVGSTNLAPATVDVLGYAPGRVDAPRRALPRFVSANPDHPYARVGPEGVAASVAWFRERVPRYVGGIEENLLLPTALGVPRPSAVVPETMAPGDLRTGGRFVFVGIRALKDFYPHIAADNLARAGLPGVSSRGLVIDPRVDGEADPGPLRVARWFEDAEFRKAVISELEGRIEPGEAVGFPAVLGVEASVMVWRELQDALSAPVFEVPVLPPSVPGIRLFGWLRAALRRAGGRMVVGSPVVGAEVRDGRVEAVVAESAARPVHHAARSFVLATGGIASGGIALDSQGGFRETVFGLPLAGVPGPGGPRFHPGYLEPQPSARLGVAVDERMRPVDGDGSVVHPNLHAAGATLTGAEPWREKSGDGISLATGYAAAGAILEG